MAHRLESALPLAHSQRGAAKTGARVSRLHGLRLRCGDRPAVHKPNDCPQAACCHAGCHTCGEACRYAGRWPAPTLARARRATISSMLAKAEPPSWGLSAL